MVLWEMATLAEQPYQGWSNDEVTRLDSPQFKHVQHFCCQLNCKDSRVLWTFLVRLITVTLIYLSSFLWTETAYFCIQTFTFNLFNESGLWIQIMLFHFNADPDQYEWDYGLNT